MKNKIQIILIIIGIAISIPYFCIAQNTDTNINKKIGIDFKSESYVIFDSYKRNKSEIEILNSTVAKYEDLILTGNGHIRLVANIPTEQKTNLDAINLGAIRAAAIGNYLKTHFRFITKWNFSFLINLTENYNSINTIDVFYINSPLELYTPVGIFYSLQRDNQTAIRAEMKKYGNIPYLENSVTNTNKPKLSIETDGKATNPLNVESIKTNSNPKDVLIAIYFRWNKSNLDSLYLSNPKNLSLLDSILKSNNTHYIDSLTIVAFASPEGPPSYNKHLSEQRANTIQDYIKNNYPNLSQSRIETLASGENWDGALKFAEVDNMLPSREKVLEILKSNLNDISRQKSLTALDGGRTYYRYILPNYYRYLRNGVSLFITRSPDRPKTPEITPPIAPVATTVELEPITIVESYELSDTTNRNILALRTNLLYNAIGALNLGIELPFGKQKKWSLIIDGAYSYWRSSKNLYALQTLEYGTEIRYWFGANKNLKNKKAVWANPLKGFNVGAYGRYWQRYDMQWIDGCQGDGSWSVGLTAGYSFPIGRQLAFEASLGAGWIHTSEYRNYHQPEYDENGKYHLMWQETGSWNGLSLTKLRFSLVWLIQTKSIKKGGIK